MFEQNEYEVVRKKESFILKLDLRVRIGWKKYV